MLAATLAPGIKAGSAHWPVALGGAQVGVAYARGLDLEQNLPRLGSSMRSGAPKACTTAAFMVWLTLCSFRCRALSVHRRPAPTLLQNEAWPAFAAA